MNLFMNSQESNSLPKILFWELLCCSPGKTESFKTYFKSNNQCVLYCWVIFNDYII